LQSELGLFTGTDTPSATEAREPIAARGRSRNRPQVAACLEFFRQLRCPGAERRATGRL